MSQLMSQLTKLRPFMGYITFILYVWFLPLISDWASRNDDSTLCNSRVVCSDGTSFGAITGNSVGCGCGEGIFGQASCPVGASGYTISGFISTAPATAIMAVLSTSPIMSMWHYGTGAMTRHTTVELQTPTYLSNLSYYSLVSFQINYALFLGGTYCIFSTFHDVVVTLFAMSALTHFFTVAYIHRTYYKDRVGAREITILASISTVAFISLIVGGILFDEYKETELAYIGWFSECVGLSAGFLIAPIMSLNAEEEHDRISALNL